MTEALMARIDYLVDRIHCIVAGTPVRDLPEAIGAVRHQVETLAANQRPPPHAAVLANKREMNDGE